MGKYIILLIFCFQWHLQVNAQTPAKTKKQAKLLFFDDFSGSQLNRQFWNVEVTGTHVNGEQQAYVDSNATIQLVKGVDAKGAVNGALKLMPKYVPGFTTYDGKKFDFISGRINTKTKAEFQYGSFEARIKLTDGVGLWPAWWILGGGKWPETGEIDIMENIGETDWVNAAIHGPGYSGDAGLVNRLYLDKKNDVTQWHIYAVDWTPNTLLFKVDGKLMFRITKPMTSFFGKWSFDNKKYLILNYAVGGVYPFKINGIEKPYYGLSENAFQKIKQNKSYMLVDWVKVKEYIP